MHRVCSLSLWVVVGCGSGGGGGDGGILGDSSVPLPVPVCDSAGGSTTVSAPTLTATLYDRWHEAWLGSPAVVDLDGDGTIEILVARAGVLLGWHIDGTVVFRGEVEGRIWSSPVVVDLLPERSGL